MKMQIKTKFVKIFCLCMAIMMIITCIAPFTSYAAESEPFIITGEYKGNFSLTTNEERLFNIFEAAPGNVYKGKIIVNNTGRDKMDIAIVDIESNISDKSLYEQLELKISKDGYELYSGKYGETAEPVTDFFRVNGRSSIEFDIEVTFPEYSDNDLQGKSLDSTWTFEAQYHNKERIKTGHEINPTNPMDKVIPTIIFISAALIGASIVLIIYFRKKEKKERG